MFFNKYIYSDMEQLQSGRGVPFVIFQLRPLAMKNKKWQFGLVFLLMKGKRNVFFFFVLKTDKGEVKVLIEEKVLKILSKIVVIFCLCLF